MTEIWQNIWKEKTKKIKLFFFLLHCYTRNVLYMYIVCGLCLQFYFCQTTHLAEISGEIQYKVLQHLAKKVRKLITDCTIYSCTVPAHVYGNLYSHTSTHTYTLRVNFITHAYFFQNIHKAFIMHSQVLVRTLRVESQMKRVFLNLIFLQP